MKLVDLNNLLHSLNKEKKVQRSQHDNDSDASESTEGSLANPEAPGAISTYKTPTAVIHALYPDPSSLPAKPPNHTRFVCISDTHGRTFDVPPGDVLLHSGDITNTGMVKDFEVTMDWICALPHKVKIIIAGNHDLTLHRSWYETHYPRWHRNTGKEDTTRILNLLTGPTAVSAGVVYVEDRTHTFTLPGATRKWTVYGSPWQPEFCGWAFAYHRGVEAEARLKEFPLRDIRATDANDEADNSEKIDILLTHGPPHHILDRTVRGDHPGCEALRSRMHQLQPRLHVFGHIHEAHGVRVHSYKSNPSTGKMRLEDSPINYAVTDEDEEVAAVHTTTTETGSGSSRKDPETIFVNAANWPSGYATRDDNGHRVGFGGGRFCPVVVDLAD